MINLKTNCSECSHEKICRNICKPVFFKKLIESTNYGDGPNDDYGLDVASDHYHVTIDIYCNDFEKCVPKRKEIENY